MISVEMPGLVKGVQVATTDYRGWSTEELAQRAADKIVHIGDQSHPAIQTQARAFKNRVKYVIAFYLNEAVKQEHATIAQRLRNAGHPEVIKLLGE